MRATKRCLLSICLFAATFAARAQDRKPGLYDVTLTTTTVAPTASTRPPRTWQACLTRDMIDKYGAIVPDRLTRACQLANVDKKQGGTTADLVCSGPIVGKGTLEVTWSDSEHSKGNLHFSGTIRPGEDEIKIEWTAITTSVYKGPDCGAIKPAAPPAAPTPPTPDSNK